MNNKLLKKIAGIFGYKLIEKDFIKNQRLISEQSSLNLKNTLNKIFKDFNITSIFQIGANDGDKFDIFVFEKETVNILDDKTKDGIHILFSVNTDPTTQQMIRNEVLKNHVPRRKSRLYDLYGNILNRLKMHLLLPKHM